VAKSSKVLAVIDRF